LSGEHHHILGAHGNADGFEGLAQEFGAWQKAVRLKLGGSNVLVEPGAELWVEILVCVFSKSVLKVSKWWFEINAAKRQVDKSLRYRVNI
jgi:hypothetical protein